MPCSDHDAPQNDIKMAKGEVCGMGRINRHELSHLSSYSYAIHGVRWTKSEVGLDVVEVCATDQRSSDGSDISAERA